jgi:hypothetical protein
LRTVNIELESEALDRPEAITVRDFEHPASALTQSQVVGNMIPGYDSHDLNKAKKLRVVVYVNRPFMFTFLFNLRTDSLAMDSLYRSLHHQLAPLRKPLLLSTSYRPERPGTDAGSGSNRFIHQYQTYQKFTMIRNRGPVLMLSTLTFTWSISTLVLGPVQLLLSVPKSPAVDGGSSGHVCSTVKKMPPRGISLQFTKAELAQIQTKTPLKMKERGNILDPIPDIRMLPRKSSSSAAQAITSASVQIPRRVQVSSLKASASIHAATWRNY